MKPSPSWASDSTAGGTTAIDQRVLRQCLGLASSFLLTDTTINPLTGADTWYIGFSRLVDIVVALHARDELELDTVNTASSACSECWMVAGSWRSLLDCRNKVKEVATKLRRILDPNNRTYRGYIVIQLEFSVSCKYTPFPRGCRLCALMKLVWNRICQSPRVSQPLLRIIHVISCFMQTSYSHCYM